MNISNGAQFHWHGWTKFSFKTRGNKLSLKTLQEKATLVYELYTVKQWSCTCRKCGGLRFKDMICDKCFKPVKLRLPTS
jgi:hypothetical protein